MKSKLKSKETSRQEITVGNFTRLNDFISLPYESQLKEYFQGNIVRCWPYTLRFEDTPKYLSFERFEAKVQFSGKAFFIKNTNTHKFFYNKETKKTRCIYERSSLLMDLIEFPQFDWLAEGYKNDTIHYKVLSNSIIRDILLGKLTNVEDIVKRYLKSLHLKNINWKTYVKYLYNGARYPINWLSEVTTDVNGLMEGLSSSNSERKIKLGDMVQQALMLQMKINPKWSDRRLDEEHNKMTLILMGQELDAKENTPIYESWPKLDYDYKLLNSEQEVFQEGMLMHHCIYTNYWRRIKNHDYIAFSFTSPERFTLGLSATPTGFQFDQAYLKYDQKISERSRATIDAFLEDEDIKRYLNKIHELYYRPNTETSQDLQLVEDWLPF